MSWPLPHEFNEAIQNPRTVFADSDLKMGEAVIGVTGLPLPHSGNFADVYQVRGADGREWAVKCFTRSVAGLADRYAGVSKALARANLPFTVGFAFLPQGIRVGGTWRPVVKMEWVEGLLLNQVARENAAKPAVLAALGQMWVRLCKRLREAGIAHADLQNGNVLLVPGLRSGSFSLKLIDYDGMWVPALANVPSGEAGHPSYQHPARAATRTYSPDVDRFPHLVVATALAGLAVGGASLWEKYDNGDNLLFTEADFQQPAGSKMMRELWQTEHPEVQALVGRLAVACGKPIPQTPWLDQLAPDGEPIPLDDTARRESLVALGMTAPVIVAMDRSSLGASPASAPSEVVAGRVIPIPVKFAPQTAPPLTREDRRRAKPIAVEKSEHDEPRPLNRARKPADESPRPGSVNAVPVWVWAVAAAVIVCIVVGTVFLLRSKPELAVQTKGEVPIKSTDSTAPKHTVQTKGEELVKPAESTAPKPAPVVPPQDPKQKDPPRPLPKEKAKESDPPALKPKDQPQAEPVVLKQRWSVPADSDGAPAVLRVSNKTIFWGSPRTSLAVLDLRTGEKRSALNSIDLTGGNSFFPLDGEHVAKHIADDRDVRTWDAQTGELSEKIPVPNIPPGDGDAKEKQAWVSPNGRHIVTARGAAAPGTHQAVPFHVFTTGKVGKSVVETTWTGGAVHFTPDSSRMLVAEYSGRFRWFSLTEEAEPQGWEYPSPPQGLTHAVTDIAAGGQVIGYNGPARSETRNAPCLVNGKTGDVLYRFGGAYAQTSPIALSADGRYAAVLLKPDGAEATVEVIRVPKGEAVARATVQTKGATPTFALSPDGRILLVHDPKAGTLWRFDLP